MPKKMSQPCALTKPLRRLCRTGTVLRLLLGVAVCPLSAGAEQMGFHWQQGVWFSFPSDYLNPKPDPGMLEIYENRVQFVEFLASRSSENGFSAGGTYDPGKITEAPGAIAVFAFSLIDGRPNARDIAREEDLVAPPDDPSTPDLARMDIIWPGGTAGAPPATLLDRLELSQRARSIPARPPPRPRIPEARSDLNIDYESYSVEAETAQLVAALNCATGPDFNGHPPMCRGGIWQPTTNVVLSLVFPETQMRQKGGWIAVANRAFDLVKRWRMKR